MYNKKIFEVYLKQEGEECTINTCVLYTSAAADEKRGVESANSLDVV